MSEGVEVYRCQSCNSAFLLNLKTGEGCSCGSSRFSPTNPSFFEVVKLLPLAIWYTIKKNRENKNGR